MITVTEHVRRRQPIDARKQGTSKQEPALPSWWRLDDIGNTPEHDAPHGLPIKIATDRATNGRNYIVRVHGSSATVEGAPLRPNVAHRRCSSTVTLYYPIYLDLVWILQYYSGLDTSPVGSYGSSVLSVGCRARKCYRRM